MNIEKIGLLNEKEMLVKVSSGRFLIMTLPQNEHVNYFRGIDIRDDVEIAKVFELLGQ